MSDLLEFDIKRPEWYRGKRSTDSRLLRKEDGMKCCVGFYCLAKGVPPEHIEGRTTIGSVVTGIETRGTTTRKTLEEDTSVERARVLGELYWDNDRIAISEKERERIITEGFLKLGAKPRFVD